MAEALPALVGPAGVDDSQEGEASEAVLDEVTEGDFGDGAVIGVDEWKGAVAVITEDINNGDALGNELVRALASGVIVDAGDDTIDVTMRRYGFDV